MKWIFRLFVLGFVVTASGFFIKDEHGAPLWTLHDLKSVKSKALAVMPDTTVKKDEEEVIREVYKWRDQNGVWQYSDEPPISGKLPETLTVSNKTNIIQSIPVDKPEPKVVSDQQSQDEKTREVVEKTKEDDSLSFERALNVVDEAKAASALMDARNKQLENIGGVEK